MFHWGLARFQVSKPARNEAKWVFETRKNAQILERRVYEIARKHCGRQPDWRVGLETLMKKTGSASPRRVFRKMMRDMIEANHLPDYTITEEAGDILRFERRDTMVEDAPLPALAPETLETARALAPGADVYALVAEWQGYWRRSGQPRLCNRDAAFLGWLKVRAER